MTLKPSSPGRNPKSAWAAAGASQRRRRQQRTAIARNLRADGPHRWLRFLWALFCGFFALAFAEPLDLVLLALERLLRDGRRQVARLLQAQGSRRRVFGFGRQRLAGVAEAGDPGLPAPGSRRRRGRRRRRLTPGSEVTSEVAVRKYASAPSAEASTKVRADAALPLEIRPTHPDCLCSCRRPAPPTRRRPGRCSCPGPTSASNALEEEAVAESARARAACRCAAPAARRRSRWRRAGPPRRSAFRRIGLQEAQTSPAPGAPGAVKRYTSGSGSPLLMFLLSYGARSVAEETKARWRAVGADPSRAGGRRDSCLRSAPEAIGVTVSVVLEEEARRRQVIDVGAVRRRAEDALQAAAGVRSSTAPPLAR